MGIYCHWTLVGKVEYSFCQNSNLFLVTLTKCVSRGIDMFVPGYWSIWCFKTLYPIYRKSLFLTKSKMKEYFHEWELKIFNSIQIFLREIFLWSDVIRWHEKKDEPKYHKLKSNFQKLFTLKKSLEATW